MPRQIRREFAGAIYHLMNRGDRREEIFRNGMDRRTIGDGQLDAHLGPARGPEKKRTGV